METLLWRNMLKKDDSGYSHFMLSRCLVGIDTSCEEIAEGHRLLETAAEEKKCTNAQFFLGALCEMDENIRNNKAIHFYKLAAAQKHIDAMADIARLCTYGVPGAIDINHVEALKFGIVAADAGSNLARCTIGDSLKSGLAGVVEIPKALSYYRAAAEEKENQALSRLGSCYAKGVGVAVDLKEARRL